MTNKMQSTNRETVINRFLTELTSLTTHPVTQIPGSNLLIGDTNVLIRSSSKPNTHMCVELYHMGKGNEWVKSWGLHTGDVNWLVHLGEGGKVHNWYNLGKLRNHVANMIATGEYPLVNNPNVRNHNRPNTNVMNVWVPHTLSVYRWDTPVLAEVSYTRFLNKLGSNHYGT